MPPFGGRPLRPVLIACLLSLPLLTSGCAWVKSQWGEHPEPAPQLVHELEVRVPAQAQMPIVLQYWRRNALLLDLQDVASTGELTLAPRDGGTWPAHLELRVTPGRFEVLELRGEQRVVYPVAPAATPAGPVIVKVDPGVYTKGTPTLSVRWGGR